jgi:hypothetical protein
VETRRHGVTARDEIRPGTRPRRGQVVRLRLRLRLAPRADARPPEFRRVTGDGVLIRLDERRAVPVRPTSPDGVWLVVALTAMLLLLVVSRFLH